MRKKILALVLALVMVIAMLPTVAFAADFADTKGHWAETQIDRWSDFGVVGGDGTGFNPNGSMTRAQAAQVFVNLLKLTKAGDIAAYTDVPATAWYADAISKVVEKGIMNGVSATTMNPNGTLTREQMFVMIGRALGVEPVQTATKTFADGAQTSPWAEGYINALANMGVIKGVGENKLNPTGDINRASVMTVLDNLIGGYANEDGQTVEIVEGKITLIVADDVKVTGEADPDVPIVVAGAAKTVDLEGVTVTGDEAPVVQVQVSDVAIENAPTGTSVTASEGATGVTANGAAVEAGGEAVEAPAPETETQTGTQTQTPTPAPVPSTPSTPEKPTAEAGNYRIIFDATLGGVGIVQENNNNLDACYGGNNTCYGGENTCYGGENEDGNGVKWLSITVTVNDVEKGITLEQLGIKEDDNSALKLVAGKDIEGYTGKGWYHLSSDKNHYNSAGSYSTDYTLVDSKTNLLELWNGEKDNNDVNIIVLTAVWTKGTTGTVDTTTCYGGENDQNGTYGSGTSGTPDNIPSLSNSVKG